METYNATETPPTPKSSKIKKLLLGLVLLSLVILLCLGTVVYFAFDRIKNNFESVTQSVPIFADKPVHNQIAIVGNDNNLWLVSPDGTGLHHITTDSHTYRYPTWAPDDRYIAFVGLADNGSTALYVTPAYETRPTILFNDPDAAPFYLYWSPDSHLITFLTQEKSGLAMRQADAIAGTGRVLAEGSPFYWVWSPTSDKLLMHVGGAQALSSEAHLSILENRDDAKRVQLNLAPGRFQAPVWSADGKFFFYIAEDDKGQEGIYKTDAQTLEQTKVTDLAGFVYMVLSPIGQHLAYLEIQSTRPPFGDAFIVDADGQNQHRLTDNLVGSMYWSPDGQKLALLTVTRQQDSDTAKAAGLASPLPQEILFRWLIYHVETKEIEPLISFDPTLDFLQIVPFFDQYHLSLTFWSPDSRYLVIAKENPEQKNEGTIWVVDTTDQEEPRQVGEGRLAVWSWQ